MIILFGNREELMLATGKRKVYQDIFSTELAGGFLTNLK